MAKNAMNPRAQKLKKLAGEMRSMAGFVDLIEYELIAVRHTAVARAEAIVKTTAMTNRKEVSGVVEVLAFRHKPDGDIAMPTDDGHWYVQQNCIFNVMHERFLDLNKAS